MRAHDDPDAARTAGVIVSVGIPTLNRSVFLQEALNSILAQVDATPRVTVVDNASTDSTPSVVRGLSSAGVHLVVQPIRLARTENYNRALQVGVEEYVGLLADDDLWHPDFLASALEAFSQPDIVIVHTGYEFVDVAGHRLHVVDAPAPAGRALVSGRQYIEWLMAGTLAFEFSATLLRRSALPRQGFLPEDDSADDIGLLLRTAQHGQVAFVNQPLARVRIHGDSVTAAGSVLPINDRYWLGLDYRVQAREAKLRFLAEHCNELDDSAHLSRSLHRCLRRHLLVPAARELRRRRVSTAWRALLHDTAYDRRSLLDVNAWKWAVAAFLRRQH